MADSITLKKIRDGFSERIEGMLSRAKSPQGGFARVYSLYQKLQTERFKTEGSSEGTPWKALAPKYAAYKRRRYGGGPKRGGGNWRSYPGAGSKMMIATSTLAGAVIGPGSPFQGKSKHRAMFQSRAMIIRVEQTGANAEGKPFDYASHANESRPLMKFSKKSMSRMKKELAQFVLKGK